jgi:hypothetical protein
MILSMQTSFRNWLHKSTEWHLGPVGYLVILQLKQICGCCNRQLKSAMRTINNIVIIELKNKTNTF